MHLRRTRLALALALATSALGCNQHPLKKACYGHYGETTTQVSMDVQRKVDILFVIDDSGSMGEEQAALAANFSALIEELEATEVVADYRVAITTTNNAHPFCLDADAQLGALQMRSCRSHLDDFVFRPNTPGEVDRREEACLSQCPESLADLAPMATPLSDGGPAAPRPWLERGQGGLTNVPDGVSTAQALACWGPQGISGCGYESPLEAMMHAFDRSGDAADAGYGFLREDALLQVVFITDEADCSWTEAGVAAFDPNGSKALWPDPSQQQAPSAVCWNAGVSCQTMPDGRIDCEPADLDTEGQPAAEGQSVLHPLSRYLERLEQLDAIKRQRLGDDRRQILLSVIAGVPSGYAGEPIDYGPGDDAWFRDFFGVGAGCSSGNGEAVPPVRLRSLVESFSEDPATNLFSICEGDYRPALRAIGQRLVEQLAHPTCVDAAGLGSQAVVDGRVEHCIVQRKVGIDPSGIAVPTCLPDGEGWALPEGAEVCSYAVTNDQVHPSCAADEHEIELRFLQAPGTDFGSVEVTCEAFPTTGCTDGLD